jgi:hypothetical protein
MRKYKPDYEMKRVMVDYIGYCGIMFGVEYRLYFFRIYAGLWIITIIKGE